MSYRHKPTESLKEEYKFYFEAVKHLTTLNAGSIVIIGSFLSDIFPRKGGILAVGLGIKILIAAAFLLFGLSLMLSVYAMYGLSRHIGWGHSMILEESVRVSTLPLLSFVVALLCFGLAVMLNLFL
jgi:hypothetical protein